MGLALPTGISYSYLKGLVVCGMGHILQLVKSSRHVPLPSFKPAMSGAPAWVSHLFQGRSHFFCLTLDSTTLQLVQGCLGSYRGKQCVCEPCCGKLPQGFLRIRELNGSLCCPVIHAHTTAESIGPFLMTSGWVRVPLNGLICAPSKSCCLTF